MNTIVKMNFEIDLNEIVSDCEESDSVLEVITKTIVAEIKYRILADKIISGYIDNIVASKKTEVINRIISDSTLKKEVGL